jgi:hypothetical protein
MLHSEIVSEPLMSWKSEEQKKSSSETMGAGISFRQSAIVDMQETSSGGESKKESLKAGVSADTKPKPTSFGGR